MFKNFFFSLNNQSDEDDNNYKEADTPDKKLSTVLLLLYCKSTVFNAVKILLNCMALNNISLITNFEKLEQK